MSEQWSNAPAPSQEEFNTLATQVSEHNQAIANIGTIITGTNEESLSVPSATYTKVSSVTLPAGTYIVKAHTTWAESFSERTLLRLLNGGSVLVEATVRSNGLGGGGDITEAFVKLTSQAIINFELHQASGSSKTASSVSLKAIRLA